MGGAGHVCLRSLGAAGSAATQRRALHRLLAGYLRAANAMRSLGTHPAGPGPGAWRPQHPLPAGHHHRRADRPAGQLGPARPGLGLAPEPGPGVRPRRPAGAGRRRAARIPGQPDGARPCRGRALRAAARARHQGGGRGAGRHRGCGGGSCPGHAAAGEAALLLRMEWWWQHLFSCAVPTASSANRQASPRGAYLCPARSPTAPLVAGFPQHPHPSGVCAADGAGSAHPHLPAGTRRLAGSPGGGG